MKERARPAFRRVVPLLLVLACAAFTQTRAPGNDTGIFEDHTDVGTVLHPGSVRYDAASGTYRISGSGENMWFATDTFQFVWKKVSGDTMLTADIAFEGTGGDPHRKAVLMMRQSLEPDSAYADAALHGDGLTSLQVRDEKGAATHEIQSRISGPQRLRLTKRGGYFYMSVAAPGQPLEFAGGWMRVPFDGTFYVGIGVCAHNKDRIETADFTRVELTPLAASSNGATQLHSTLETITVASTDRRVAYTARGRIEAPNWLSDNATLLFNQDGRMKKLSIASGQAEVLDTGFAANCTANHGASPGGESLAITDESNDKGMPSVYTLPLSGGKPLRVTGGKYASYWHGWSPDGKTIAFTAGTAGRTDIFTVPATGGPETRLTHSGVNDGPEFSPDGKYLYFNSDRGGTMQIWRMNSDGTGMEAVTSDAFNNWFPHISPDGKQMAFLSFDAATAGCPEDVPVTLRVLTFADGKIKVLGKFLGGKGSFDAPSWSPDSKRLAFVSYQLIPK